MLAILHALLLDVHQFCYRFFIHETVQLACWIIYELHFSGEIGEQKSDDRS